LGSLYAECHDRVHNIIVVLPQRLDGLLAGNAGLSHDQLDVLSLETSLVNRLTIILLLFLLGLGLGGLALAVVVIVVVVVVVTGVLTGSLGGSKLLGGGSLGLGVQVLDLGLTENARWKKSATRFRVGSKLVQKKRHTSRCCWRGSGRLQAG
jgi:hypothetical protein